MEKLDFTLEELQQLESLLECSAKISNIIDSLYILDITEQKESSQYEIKLQELKQAIDNENKTYQTANLSYQQCLKYSKLLSSQTNISIFDDKAPTSIKHYNNRIFKRVINILITLVQNNPDFHQNIISNSLLIDSNTENTNTIQNSFTKGLSNSFKVQLSLNDDINSMFLSILESYIPQSKYQQELTKVKYTLATTHKSLEQLILENKFNIPNTIYLGSQLMNELFQESQLSYEIIRFAELKTKAKIEINKIIEITDNEYLKDSTKIDSIISNCYLRALLSLMKDEEVENLEQEFKIKTQQPEYLYKHINDQISENMILSCFQSSKYDKKRTRVLTTKTNL